MKSAKNIAETVRDFLLPVVQILFLTELGAADEQIVVYQRG